MESVSTSNHNGAVANGDAKHAFFGKLGSPTEVALKADCLCKTYDGHQEAVKDVTFSVKSGEVREIPILESFESLYRTETFFDFFRIVLWLIGQQWSWKIDSILNVIW